MSIKRAIRALVKSAGAYEQASRAWIWLEPRSTRVIRALTGSNQRITREYLASTPQPRLHVGCGDNHLNGWLNTELTPRGDEVFLDATRPFPFASDTFALIYSEHMIEHIPYRSAIDMARECFRVLRPGGTIRLVTPDMAFLRALLNDEPNPRRAAYFEFYKQHNRIAEPFTATHLVNHFVRAWGHQFIYDADTLLALLRDAGFVSATRAELTNSTVAGLRGLAKLDRMPDGFVEMESLTVEARKPA